MKTDEQKQRRVGVLMGGLSSEREVSLETGGGVLRALAELGYDVVALDWTAGQSVAELVTCNNVEIVWNALHGTYGEDGAVQGLLACLGIPCTGSGILASALAMDKIASKRIFESNGVPTPAWRVLLPDVDPNEQLAGLDVPLVVKPANEGSSVGVTIVRNSEALSGAIALARAHRGPTLVEAYVAGAEIQVGILDDQVLGSIEVRPASEFYDYEAKYKRNDTQYLIPPTIDESRVAACETVALAAYRALGCSGHSRVDLMVRKDGEALCLEVNTLPGMTSHSLLPKIAAHVGMTYGMLCEAILRSAARGG